jgi:hypothetical protein
VNVHRWLVVRDRTSHVLDYRELAPYSDLRAAMAAERASMMVDGWNCGDTPSQLFVLSSPTVARSAYAYQWTASSRGRAARPAGVSGREGEFLAPGHLTGRGVWP